MKTNLLKTLLCGLALLTSVAASAQEKTLPENVRHYFAVTGYNGETPVTVSNTVYYGFGFEVQMPDKNNAIVGANKFKLEVGINDVTTLNALGESRYREKTFTTKSGFEGDLAFFLSSAYEMQAVTVPVKVIDDVNGTREMTYSIAPINSDYKIIGTPSSYEEAYDAWYMIASNMKSVKKVKNDDTYVKVKKGAYIQFGDERMMFRSDQNLFTQPWDKNSELAKITANTSILDPTTTEELANLTAPETFKAILFLPAGSVLSVGGSMSTLTKDAKITIDLSRLCQGSKLTGQLSSIQEYIASAKDRTRAAIETFLGTFNTVVGLISMAGNVPVTVEFADVPANLDVYTVEGCTPDQTEEQFNTIKATYPNAMAIANYGQAEDPTNIIFAQANGDAVCYHFVLTDLTTVADDVCTDWYSPCDFYVVSGQYVRKGVPTGYASACLPFEVSSEELNGSDILTFDTYDGKTLATFVSGTEAEAGVPFMTYATGGDWDIDLQDKEVKAAIQNGNSTYGTYAVTDEYATYFYGVNPIINKFAPLANDLYPFRACLELNAAVQAGVKEISINRVAVPTSISKVQTATEGKAIYNVSGAKLDKITKSGLYIVNGKKVYVK